MPSEWHRNPLPHRRLHRGHRGADVKRFQIGLNARLDHHPRSEGKIAVDGDFGDETLRAWRQVRWIIGLPAEHPPTRRAQLNVRRPWTRNPAAAARARRRRKALEGTGGERAVRFLLDRAGWTENGNRAPWLDRWALEFVGRWMLGQPWCGLACIAAWHFAAGKTLPDGTVYTPNIVVWARRGEHFRAVAASQARPGDLVVFDFPGGSPVADHVGLARGPARGGVIPTIEGNTLPGNVGSQANGGGIFARSRPVGLVAVVARPI